MQDESSRATMEFSSRPVLAQHEGADIGIGDVRL